MKEVRDVHPIPFQVHLANELLKCRDVEGLWRHILLRLHMLSSTTIHAGTCTYGTNCRPKACIVTGNNVN